MTVLIHGRERRLPSWWAGAGYTVKAGWLCSQGLSYSAACSVLASRKRKHVMPTAQEAYAALEKRGLA